MSVEFQLNTTPYLAPLVAFANEYGLLVIGAFLLRVSFSGRRFCPLALLPLVLGLGLVLAGAAHLVFPLVGR